VLLYDKRASLPCLLRPGGGAYRSGTGKTDLEITPRPGDYPRTTNRHLRPAGLPIRLTAPVSTAAVATDISDKAPPPGRRTPSLIAHVPAGCGAGLPVHASVARGAM